MLFRSFPSHDTPVNSFEFHTCVRTPQAGYLTRYPIAAIIGTIGIILAALYILIPVQRALHGPVTEGNDGLPDLNRRELIAIAPIIASIIGLGFYPKPALDVINPAAKATITKAGMVDPLPTVGGEK